MSIYRMQLKNADIREKVNLVNHRDPIRRSLNRAIPEAEDLQISEHYFEFSLSDEKADDTYFSMLNQEIRKSDPHLQGLPIQEGEQLFELVKS